MQRREFLRAGTGTRADAQRRRRFPDLPLTTHQGKRVRLYTDLLKGKTVLVHFMYTTCTTSCPRTTANLSRVRDLLGARVGRDIFLYSVSVDPEYDTPVQLSAYAARFKVSPGWSFLTGKPADILILRRLFGDDPSKASDDSNHLNLLAYGVEPLQRWGACPALLAPRWVVRYLSWLDPKGERPSGWWPTGHLAGE